MKRRGRNDVRKILKKLLTAAEAIARLFGLKLFLVRDAKEADYCILDRKIWLPFQEGNENVRLYQKGLGKTGSGSSDSIYRRLRFSSLFQMIRHVLSRNIEGDFAECGVWKGHSAWCAAALIREHGGSRRFHIFDSFEGLSERGGEMGRDFPSARGSWRRSGGCRKREPGLFYETPMGGAFIIKQET